MNVKIANFVTAKFYKASDGRNGYSSKKMKTDSGILEQNISRDRELEFHPQIVRKCQRRGGPTSLRMAGGSLSVK